MSDMVTIEELQEQLCQVSAERDRLRQDLADMLPEADATAWALTEMNIALKRAQVAEGQLAALKRGLLVSDEVLRRAKVQVPGEGAPVAIEVAPQPLIPTAAGRTVQGSSMEDILGYPKEGR